MEWVGYCTKELTVFNWVFHSAWSQSTAAAMPAPTINPQTGQPDYSAAWAEYYRRQGMHEYADMILRQAQAGGQAATQGVAQNTAQAAAAYSSTPVKHSNPFVDGIYLWF